MATSGTAVWNPDLTEIVEEAFERCGAEMRSGYDLRTAKRSLNILFMEWASRGLNMWTFEEGQIPLIAGTASYNLPADTVDLMDQVVRTGTGSSQVDIMISRISASVYSAMPTKTSTGRPIQIRVTRTNTPSVTLWPVPDQTGVYTLVYWRLRRMQDAGGGVNTMDMPFRFVPCMIAGLAYHLSLKIPQAIERREMLKAEYDQAWIEAAGEDREKSSVRFVPRMGC